jgi:hypothetical protein
MDITQSTHPCANAGERSCPFKIWGPCLYDAEDSNHRQECCYCLLDNEENADDNEDKIGSNNECNKEEDQVNAKKPVSEGVELTLNQSNEGSGKDKDEMAKEDNQYKTPRVKHHNDQTKSDDNNDHDAETEIEGDIDGEENDSTEKCVKCPACDVEYVMVTGYITNPEGVYFMKEKCTRCIKDGNNPNRNLRSKVLPSSSKASRSNWKKSKASFMVKSISQGNDASEVLPFLIF